ncbi:MAG: glycosyltransferase [Proteobacteria bacterium]|nr:glycosyltransferase [Pseudomonadota bacterium]
MDMEPSETQMERPVPDDLVGEVRDARAELGLGRVTVAVPYAIPEKSAEALLALQEVAGIVLANENSALALRFPKRVGWLQTGGRLHRGQRQWHLPEKTAPTLLFFGTRSQISFFMGLAALRHGVFWVVLKTLVGWARRPIPILVGQRLMLAAVMNSIGLWRHVLLYFTVLRRTAHAATRIPVIGRVVSLASRRLGSRTGKKFNKIVSSLTEDGTATGDIGASFVPSRIVLANSALAWGGAERQLVNTAVGLTGEGLSDVSVLCERGNEVLDHDFFRWRLEEAAIDVSKLQHETKEFNPDSRLSRLYEFLRPFQWWAPGLADGIGYYALEFLRRRPEVVHAWQDGTCIKAGLAAAFVGVPKIVLSTRNLAPYRFNYHLPYMRSGYRALLALPNVTLLNNSEAGAADYAEWLDVPVERLRVIHNGSDFTGLGPTPREISDFRRQHGIPDGTRIVGSVFRFYNEKDPLLWVRTAARIARARPDVIFLLVGTGPMQAKLMKLADRLGIADRLFLPGTEKNIAPAYAAMDVLLLTSRFEGLPNVVIEAQALGVPVVATDAGGTRDAVLDGHTGWIEAKRNPSRLAARVLFVLDNPDWAAKARQRGPAFIRERFGIGRMIAETLDAYGLDTPDRRAPPGSGPGQATGD